MAATRLGAPRNADAAAGLHFRWTRAVAVCLAFVIAIGLRSADAPIGDAAIVNAATTGAAVHIHFAGLSGASRWHRPGATDGVFVV